MPLLTRPETPADHNAIRQVHRVVFGRDGEARPVDALRDGGYVRLSLVAERDGQVLGHVLLSDLPIIAQDATMAALSPAPPAVLPACRREGIGSALVRRGLELCRERGHRIVALGPRPVP
jgi:putative acetyltransferase